MRPKLQNRFIPLTLAVAIVLPGGAHARPAPMPSSTDEARAPAASLLPRRCEAEALPPGEHVVSSTDEARALAGRVLVAAPQRPSAQPMAFVSSTDEARAAAGAAWGPPDCQPAPVAAR